MVDCSSDVYISFNKCEDTVRFSFISHLSAAFHRKGVSSFIGEDGFVSELENCKISVVVFSEKYPSSKSCIEELVKVSERRGKNCLTVVPVFYSVKKSFVKKQIRNLVDVRSDWLSALLETLDLPGHESCDKQSDSDIVEEIVADVREKINITDNVGIYSRLRMMETLLCKKPWGVHSIGLRGIVRTGSSTTS